jgi:hypothetical protein
VRARGRPARRVAVQHRHHERARVAVSHRLQLLTRVVLAAPVRQQL